MNEELQKELLAILPLVQSARVMVSGLRARSVLVLLRLGASHRRRDCAARSHAGDDPMTLPKNITDAIDNFEGKSLDHWMHDHYGTDRATFDAKRQLVTDARAALEAAIAAAIQQASDLAEQRISFAFGNSNIDNPAVTKETVRAAAAIQPVEPPTDAEVEAWERLRERVQKTIDVTPRSALLGMLLTVRDWIDEERGAGR